MGQKFRTLCLESPCSIYVNVTDPTRFWESRSGSVDAIQRSCQNYEFPFWTRFLYSNTTNALIPQNCTPTTLNKGNPPCGALHRGRIQGKHPSTEDGRYMAFFLCIVLSYWALLLLLIFRWYLIKMYLEITKGDVKKCLQCSSFGKKLQKYWNR